jgi:hypothetical protein
LSERHHPPLNQCLAVASWRAGQNGAGPLARSQRGIAVAPILATMPRPVRCADRAGLSARWSSALASAQLLGAKIAALPLFSQKLVSLLSPAQDHKTRPETARERYK